MTFQLQVSVILPEMQKRLDERSIKYNSEILSQFISSKISGTNQIKNPHKPKPPVKTEITVETMRTWVRDFIRSNSPNPNH